MRWAAPLTILFLVLSLVLGFLALTNLVPGPLMDWAFCLSVVVFLGLFIRLLCGEADGSITHQRVHDHKLG